MKLAFNQLIVASSLCLVAAALSTSEAVTLLVSEQPRRPGAVASIYRGPPTYDGGRKRSSPPYIIVSRQRSPALPFGHFHLKRPFNHDYYLNPHVPFHLPLIESGRHFSYKKRPIKPKLYSAVKSSPATASTSVGVGQHRHLVNCNYGQQDFNGKYEIIKPPEKADANGRIVTYNSDGTRVLPEPIYNYHTRPSHLLWSPLQKLNRFDDQEQRSQEKAATTEVITSSLLPTTTTITTTIKTINNKAILSVLPVYYDSRFSSSTTTNVIDSDDSKHDSTTEMTSNNDVNDASVTSTVTIAPSSPNESTTFIAKFGENAKNMLSHIFGSFLNGRNAIGKQSNSRKNISSDLTPIEITTQRPPISETNSFNKTLENSDPTPAIDIFDLSHRPRDEVLDFKDFSMPNQPNDTTDKKESTEQSTIKTEIRFSEEVDPTSISGWRPLFKRPFVKEGHPSVPPTPSSHLINLMLNPGIYHGHTNDTIDIEQPLTTNSSTVETYDNENTAQTSDKTTEISTKTPRLPNSMSNSTRPTSPIEWLFGSINVPTTNTSKNANHPNITAQEFINEAETSSNDNELSLRTNETDTTADEDVMYDDDQPSNVPTIILIPHGNWSDAPRLLKEVENVTADINHGNESNSNTTNVTKEQVVNQMKNIFRHFKLGVPVVFDILQSLITYL